MNETQVSQKQKSNDWILWSVVCFFIILAIAVMWGIDFIYAPEMIDGTVLPDAAGK